MQLFFRGKYAGRLRRDSFGREELAGSDRVRNLREWTLSRPDAVCDRQISDSLSHTEGLQPVMLPRFGYRARWRWSDSVPSCCISLWRCVVSASTPCLSASSPMSPLQLPSHILLILPLLLGVSLIFSLHPPAWPNWSSLLHFSDGTLTEAVTAGTIAPSHHMWG